MPDQTPESRDLVADGHMALRLAEAGAFNVHGWAGHNLPALLAELEAAREHVADLERQVTKWQGMYRVASDHRDQNLSDLHEAARTAAWFAAERDYIRRALECMEADRNVLTGQLWGSRTLVSERDDKLAAARARIAELEAAQANPDAYIAVKRYYSAHAGGPKWNTDAEVIPAADLRGDTREWHREHGYDLLPIVGTETGTRSAAAPATDPDGYAARARLAELEAAQPDPARIERALIEAWDDGNATGLDGYAGPGRGAGDIDAEAVYNRDRVIRKVLAELTTQADPPPITAGYLVGWQGDDGQVRIELDEAENIVHGVNARAYAAAADARAFVAELAPADPSTEFRVYQLREVPGE
jgi:hypothetical protein